ncbi:MAG: cytochrome c [Candidatus Acidiferrales bacterium]|jgi:mono/diheme cytochrome c family protein
MRAYILLLFLLLFGLRLAAATQRKNSDAALNETQALGRRVFHQRCAVCHTQVSPGARRYGPVLSEDLVDGNEDAIREFIRNGSRGKMPGFKYGLESSEIDAIVEYLKTVPKPATQQVSHVDQGPVD